MKKYTAQEMRVRADYLEGALADSKTAAMLRQAADMMERESTREKSSAVGNAAAMREALSLALAFANGMYNTTNSDVYLKLAETIEEAISSPPRNCDVGNEKEQIERFLKFCPSLDCESYCPLFKSDNCELTWAQMPYEIEVKE